MRRQAWGWSIAVAMLAGLSAFAQSPWDDALAPLESGRLQVWVVVPPAFGTAPPRIIHENGRTILLTAEQAAAAAQPQPRELQHDPKWDDLRRGLERAYPHLHVDFEFLTDSDLASDLSEVMGTDDFPDVVLGTPLAPGSNMAFWRDAWIAQDEFGYPRVRPDLRPDIAILPEAPHPDAAWAFVLWLSDDGANVGHVGKTPENAEAGSIAVTAFTRLLQGQPLGAEADPELATPRLPDAEPALDVRTNITAISMNRRSAVVTLRGERGVPMEVVHALMVLRRDRTERWRVLQVSWNLAPSQQNEAVMELTTAGADWAPRRYLNEGNQPGGISQALPKDGATVAPNPKMWWDNRGGATLEVVEWQHDGVGPGRPTWLFFAPDCDNRLRTTTVARFADAAGAYRWRVWSVGAGGTIVLSPWKTMKVSADLR